MTEQIDCNQVDFGPVQLGAVRTEHLKISNSSYPKDSIKIKAQPTDSSRDFQVELIKDGESGGSAYWVLNLVFRPTEMGHRYHGLEIQTDGPSKDSKKYKVILTGEGTPAVRHTLRTARLPRRDAGTQGFHYLVVVSNTSYIRNLESQESSLYKQNCTLDWYAAISSGTRNGTVSWTTTLKPGELFFPPEDSALPKLALLNCFDLQTIFYRWSGQFQNSLTDACLTKQIDEAIGHVTGQCNRNLESCSNTLNREKLRRLMPYAPEPGSIYEFSGPSGPSLWIVISPRQLTALYHACFGRRQAICVAADLAEPTDETTLFGVRTDPIPNIGSLFVYCYTATLRAIESVPKELHYVKLLPGRIKTKDMEAVLERTRLYLGIES